MLHIPGLYISESDGRGRGVFTAQELQKGDMIEICPIILIPQAQIKAVHTTILHDFYFLWPSKKKEACIALGYGSIYNHSNSPNAEVAFDLPNNELEIRCTKALAPGDEIFIDYQGGVKQTNLWFEAV